jgi:hypothetical protein
MQLVFAPHVGLFSSWGAGESLSAPREGRSRTGSLAVRGGARWV